MSFGALLTLLSTVCRNQLGLFSRAQARAIGLDHITLRRLERAGLIERCSPQVFRLASSARSWHQSVLAATLDGGPTCVASHSTAAALHGLDGFDAGGVIEILVPMKKRLRRSNVLVHHTRTLPDEDRTRVGVIPVTSLARTLLTLGAGCDPDRVEEAFDSAERQSTRARAAVDRRYEALRAPGRNGIGAITEIRARREDPRRVPRSLLERRMQRLLNRAGLPAATSRYMLRLPHGGVVELDFAIVRYKLDLEVDGHGAHASRRQRAHDHNRQGDIEDAGWAVRRFTYEQVVHEPDMVAARIRRAIAAQKKRV